MIRQPAYGLLNSDEHIAEDEDEIQRGTDYISYFVILNKRWPYDAAKEMLKQHKPTNVIHSAPLLTLTHGEQLK